MDNYRDAGRIIIMPIRTDDSPAEGYTFNQNTKMEKGGVIEEVEFARKREEFIGRILTPDDAFDIFEKLYPYPEAANGKLIVFHLDNANNIIYVSEVPPTISANNNEALYRSVFETVPKAIMVFDFSRFKQGKLTLGFYGAYADGFIDTLKKAEITVLDYFLVLNQDNIMSTNGTPRDLWEKNFNKGGSVKYKIPEGESIVYDCGRGTYGKGGEIYKTGEFVPEFGTKVTSSKDAGYILNEFWDQEKLITQEQVIVMYLNDDMQVKYIYFHTQGGQTSSIVEAAMVLSIGVRKQLNNIIIAHNHPSGNMKPSQADIAITDRLSKLAEKAGMKLVYHIVLAKSRDRVDSFEVNGKYKQGGYVYGPSHSEGGVKMDVGDSGVQVELEGGEGVVNKHAMALQSTVEFNGKRMKPCQAVSQINQMAGGGVAMDCNSYAQGGQIEMFS